MVVHLLQKAHGPPDPRFSVHLSVCLSIFHFLIVPARFLSPSHTRSWQQPEDIVTVTLAEEVSS